MARSKSVIAIHPTASIKRIPACSGVEPMLSSFLSSSSHNFVGLCTLSSLFAFVILALFLAAPAVCQITFAGTQLSIVNNGLSSPSSIAVDHNGNLYIADTGNNRIVAATASTAGGGMVRVVASGLSGPAGVAADWSGNVYVADTGNNRILMLPVTKGSLGTPVLGTPVQIGAGFSSPTGIAVDQNANIYVSDTGNNRVVELPRIGAGYGSPVQLITGLSNPTGIAVDAARNLYIADTGNNRVLKETYSSAGYLTQQALGKSLVAPQGVAVDPSDNLYIADTGNNRIVSIAWASGSKRYSSQVRVGSDAETPTSVIPDWSGNVFVADQGTNRVVEVVSTSVTFGQIAVGSQTAQTYNFNIAAGTTIGSVGIFTEGAAGKDFVDGGTTTCTPQTYTDATDCGVSISFTPLGSGTRNGAILISDSQGNVLCTTFISGSGLMAKAAIFPGAITVLGAQLSGPSGVTVDGSGNVFIADTGNDRIVELPNNGGSYGTQTTVAMSALDTPMGITIDGAGNLYVASSGNDKIARLQWNGTSFGMQSKIDGGFYGPTGVAVDTLGNLYVADTLAQFVFQFVWTGAGFAKGQHLGGYLRCPTAVATDRTGDVFFTNPYLNSVEEVPLPGTSNSPQITFTGPKLKLPSALAVDGNSNLYVADTGNNRIVMLPWNGSGYGNQITVASGFNAPSALAIDMDGNLYVADTGNDQVVKIDLSTPQSLTFADTYLGSTSADSAKTMTVVNVGDEPLSFSSFSYPTDYPSDFNTANPCTESTSLMQGAWCKMGIDFTPTLATSPLTESFTFTIAETGAQPTVSLTGNALGKLAQTIAFPAQENITYGTTSVSLAAIASSGLPITYHVISGPAIVGRPGAALKINGTGLVIVQAVQNGNAIYATASSVTISFTVLQAVLTVTPVAATTTYGSPSATYSYTVTGFVGGQFAAQVLSGRAAVSSNGGNTPAAGTYVLTATQGTLAAANYVFVFASGTLVVNKASLIVKAVPATTSYGAKLPSLGWAFTGFVNGDGPSAISGSPAMDSVATVHSPVGNYAITPSQGTLSAANYSFIFVTGNLAVAPGVLTVTADSKTIVYGDTLPQWTYSVTGFVGSDTAQTAVTGSALIKTTAKPSCNAGTYNVIPVTGSLKSSNYTFVFIAGTLNVAKAVLNVTPDAVDAIYGSVVPAPTYKVVGFVNGDAPNVVSGSPAFLSSVSSTSAAGSYTRQGSLGTLSAVNYTFQVGNGQVNIAKAVLLVAPDAAVMSYGGKTPLFTYRVSGFVNVDSASVVSGTPSFQALASGVLQAGVYPLQGSMGTLSAANYSFQIATGQLTVNKAVLIISPNAVSMTYGSALPKVSNTMAGFVNGDNASVVSGAPAFQPSASGILKAGTYPLQGGPGTLSAANYSFQMAAGKLTVNKATLVVSPTAASMTFGDTLPKIGYTITGFVNSDTVDVVSGTPAFHPSTSATRKAGVYALEGSADTMSAENYTFQIATGQLTVRKALLVVSLSSASMVYGSAVPNIGYTVAGFIDGDGADVVSGKVVVTTNASSISSVGAYSSLANVSGLSATNYTFTSGQGVLTVTKAVLAVTPVATSMTYGGEVPRLSYTVSGFLNGDTAVVVSGSASVGTSTTAVSSVGSYPVTANVAMLSAKNYAFKAVTGILSVTKAVLAVTPVAASITYGEKVPRQTYTISGFVNGDTAVVVSGSASVGTSTTAVSSIGSYPVTANVAMLSAKNYAFKAVTGILSVTKAVLAVTPVAASITYGEKVPRQTYTISGFVNGDTADVVSGSASVGTSTTAVSSVGSYPVKANVAMLSAKNYAFKAVTGILSVTKAVLAVTPVATSMTYGGEVPRLSYTVSGFVNGDTADVVSGSASVGTSATAASSVGSYPLTANVAMLSAKNYSFKTGTSVLSVTKAILTVVPNEAVMVYGGKLPKLGYRMKGFLNGDTASVIAGSASVTTTATAESPSGTYPLSAKIGRLSARNYSFIAEAGVLTIDKAVITVAAVNVTASYGATIPALYAVMTGFAKGDRQATATTGTPRVSTTATAKSPVDTYPIKASIGTLTSANYTFQFALGTLTVEKAQLTVTADNQTMKAGSALPPLTYTVKGMVNGERAKVAMSGAPTLSTTANSTSAPGSYAILAAPGTMASANYSLTFVQGTLTVN